ncbi:MAG: hypothetical protein JST12_18575 [Armatimonadetes bacterium]|nr:hypothetical protein [Armatimonadota bacterium]
MPKANHPRELVVDEESGEEIPIRLATPNDAEVKAFAALYFERFGVELDPIEAHYVATKYVRMFQILTYEQ